MEHLPNKVSNFHLTQVLHTGIRSVVHQGRFAQAGGVVQSAAVKILHLRYACIGSELRAFLREANWAADIRSPIFPRVFEAGESKGNYFLAMEYIDGWTLAQVLSSLATLQVPLSCEVGLGIAYQLAGGLHAMHEYKEEGQTLGMVHLGVSPDNIMIGKQGNVKLVDFGMTLAGVDGGMTIADPRAEEFQAPEHIRNLPVDRRTDVYSLGRILQQMVACMVPEVVGDDLPALLARACHQDPERRFDTMGDFQVALELVSKNRGMSPTTSAIEKFTLEIFGHRVIKSDPRAKRPQSEVPLQMPSEGLETAFAPPPQQKQSVADFRSAVGTGDPALSQPPAPLHYTMSPAEPSPDTDTVVGGVVVGEAMTDIPCPKKDKLRLVDKPRFVDQHLAVTTLGNVTNVGSVSNAPASSLVHDIATMPNSEVVTSDEVTAFSDVPKPGFPEELIPTKPYSDIKET